MTAPSPAGRKPTYFAIRVQERLDSCWSECFDGMTVARADSGETVISGPVADQAALHGILATIRDLNLTLVSVNRIETILDTTQP